MKDWNPNVGEGIIPFSVADMELPNAPEIKKGLAEYALSDSVFGYTGPTEEYLKTVCGWMKSRHNYEISPEWISVFPGVVPAFFTAVNALTEKGDGVIVMTPVYYPFYTAIESDGRKTVSNALLPIGSSYEIDFEDLEAKAKDPANKVLLLCSPHNPVGRVWRRDELEEIADICLRNDVLIISDEIHNDLILPGYEHIVLASLSKAVENITITCTAPSKTFNLAGLACSNIIISNADIKAKFAAQAMKSATFSVNCFGLKACEIAYKECTLWLDELNELLLVNHKALKEFFAAKLPQIKVYDLEGTYLQWMDFRGLGMDKNELEEFLHTQAMLFFDEGYLFGESGAGFERMNLACPTRVMLDGLERLYAAVQKRTQNVQYN